MAEVRRCQRCGGRVALVPGKVLGKITLAEFWVHVGPFGGIRRLVTHAPEVSE